MVADIVATPPLTKRVEVGSYTERGELRISIRFYNNMSVTAEYGVIGEHQANELVATLCKLLARAP